MLNQPAQGLVNNSTPGPNPMMPMNLQPVGEDCVLFVGNLSPQVNDQILYEFFAPIGSVSFTTPTATQDSLSAK